MNDVRSTRFLCGVCIVAFAAGVRAQSPAFDGLPQSLTSASSVSPDTSLLATVPTPPAGTVPHPGSMSGQPLQVGDLPPGILSVRVIRGDFSRNIAGQRVDLRLESDGRTMTSLTGQDGRALFTGLAIGARVQAGTTIDGDHLESQIFPVPSLGGVRLVLVAGEASTGADSRPPTAIAEPPIGSTEPSARPSKAISSAGLTGWVVGLWSIAGGAFFYFGRGRRPAARPNPTPTPEPPQSVSDTETRERLVTSLVDVERDHKAGRLTAEEYQRRRTEIMDSLDLLVAESKAS